METIGTSTKKKTNSSHIERQKKSTIWKSFFLKYKLRLFNFPQHVFNIHRWEITISSSDYCWILKTKTILWLSSWCSLRCGHHPHTSSRKYTQLDTWQLLRASETQRRKWKHLFPPQRIFSWQPPGTLIFIQDEKTNLPFPLGSSSLHI